MRVKRVSDTEALRCIAFSCNILLAVVLVRSPDLRDNLSGRCMVQSLFQHSILLHHNLSGLARPAVSVL